MQQSFTKKLHSNAFPAYCLREAQEQILMDAVKSSKYAFPFALILYAGLRPSEVYNAQIDGKFIVVTNSKRNNDYNKYRRIPITPALIPYLTETNFSEIPAKPCLQLKMKEVLPDHTICALRHTFRKRCQKVGIPSAFMGLTSRELTDEVLLEAAEKLRD